MSRFTGKELCVYSEFFGFSKSEGDNTDWSKHTFKIWNPKTKSDENLEIKTTKDIVPYFAHMISSYGWSDGRGNYYLSATPYYVTEEKERLHWYYRDTLSYIRKCKREKQTPTYDDFMKKYYNWCHIDRKKDKVVIDELLKRVSEHPYSKEEKITKGLWVHDNLREHFKKELYNEMLKYGYTEEEAQYWVYKKWYEEN